MKTFAFSVFFSIICFVANAQRFAAIHDKDGFVNVRKSPDIKSQIVGKIYNDWVVSYDKDVKSDWIKIYNVDFESKTKISGFIYRSRLFALSKFKRIRNKREYKDSCLVHNDSLTIIVRSSTFNPKKHKLLDNKGNSTKSEIWRIDGKPFWGTDGDLPKEAITSVRIVKNNISILIPKSAVNDLFEPNFRSLQVYLGNNNTIYIEMDNSDGAGAYSIIWIIKDDQYLRRCIDNSNV
jgi:hypothetical protein